MPGVEGLGTRRTVRSYGFAYLEMIAAAAATASRAHATHPAPLARAQSS